VAAELPRKIGLLDATAIVAGTMIGAGIFLVPSAHAGVGVAEPDDLLVIWRYLEHNEADWTPGTVARWRAAAQATPA
jgi:hypothetical protein